MVSTIAGQALSPGFANGTRFEAAFSSLWQCTVDKSDNIVIADAGNHMIRKINNQGFLLFLYNVLQVVFKLLSQTEIVTTIGGNGKVGYVDGLASTAKFNYPTCVAVDTERNLFVADYNNHRIRKITNEGTFSSQRL
jgi:hypothetical protein